MKYEGAIFRPPSEAESLIIQIAVGCSHNRCTFCGSYKEKRFRIKTFEEIREDIDEAAQSGWSFDRVFLADGDALICPQRRLLEVMAYLRKKLPHLRRVGIYANAKGVLKKTVEELRELSYDAKVVDHPEGGSKDVADALCGAFWAMTQAIANAKSSTKVPTVLDPAILDHREEEPDQKVKDFFERLRGDPNPDQIATRDWQVKNRVVQIDPSRKRDR